MLGDSCRKNDIEIYGELDRRYFCCDVNNLDEWIVYRWLICNKLYPAFITVVL